MEATGDMLENKPILKSDENDVGERSCDLINGLTSKSRAGGEPGGRGATEYRCIGILPRMEARDGDHCTL